MPSDASEEVGIFEPPSTVWPSGTHFLGGNWRRIDLKLNRTESYSIIIFI